MKPKARTVEQEPRSTESYDANPDRNERILFFLTVGALLVGILSYTVYLLIWG